MQPKGSSKKNVLAELKKIRTKDQPYADGRILCSLCTRPHPIAQKAYQMFIESNLGDPGLFSGTAQLEQDVITQLSGLLHNPNACGHIVSGGTEANLLALLAAKNNTSRDKSEVILPKSAHFSFTKICKILNLQPIYARLANDYTVNPFDVANLVNQKTLAIVGTAGSAELGTIDPIDKLSEIALTKAVYFHVDAAFGGLVIPFLKGEKATFDFQNEAVQSITVDPHKMGLAAIPAGGLLFRDLKLLDSLKTKTP